jgi:hypothetical protein
MEYLYSKTHRFLKASPLTDETNFGLPPPKNLQPFLDTLKNII